ncbi:MAG TPA: hypothetical protein VKL40_10160 [Candidatus Angelobacter sp.]|nr:hypothetical protein [Candidatus Angelobacter sp.]
MAKENGPDLSALPSFDGAIRETEEFARRERDKAVKFVEALDKLLDDLERAKLSTRPPEGGRRDSGPFRYLGMPMIEAIEIFLKKAGTPQTREQICAEMRDGGAVVATARPEVEVNKSIDYWLLTESEKRHKYRKRKIKIVPPRLRRVGDKVALIEPRER